MDAGSHRRLENALICGVLTWFFAMATHYTPVQASFATVPLAFFIHLLGIVFALRVVATKPYAALAAIALNATLWAVAPWRAWSMFYN
jgi:hypothetical protein